eukprot:3634341-Rhodomonas_salina.3
MTQVPESERARCRVRLSEDPQMRIEMPSSTNTGGSAAQGAPAGGAGVTQAANAAAVAGRRIALPCLFRLKARRAALICPCMHRLT